MSSFTEHEPFVGGFQQVTSLLWACTERTKLDVLYGGKFPLLWLVYRPLFVAASCSTLSRMAVTAHVKDKGERQKEILLWVEATVIRAIINKSKAEGTPWAWGSDTRPHLK